MPDIPLLLSLVEQVISSLNTRIDGESWVDPEGREARSKATKRLCALDEAIRENQLDGRLKALASLAAGEDMTHRGRALRLLQLSHRVGWMQRVRREKLWPVFSEEDQILWDLLEEELKRWFTLTPEHAAVACGAFRTLFAELVGEPTANTPAAAPDSPHRAAKNETEKPRPPAFDDVPWSPWLKNAGWRKVFSKSATTVRDWMKKWEEKEQAEYDEGRELWRVRRNALSDAQWQAATDMERRGSV